MMENRIHKLNCDMDPCADCVAEACALMGVEPKEVTMWLSSLYSGKLKKIRKTGCKIVTVPPMLLKEDEYWAITCRDMIVWSQGTW